MVPFLSFFFTTILTVSTAGMLLVGLRAVSRLEDELQTGTQGNLWERWTDSGIPERVDRALNRVTHRTLRRLKIWILKADNALTVWLKKTREENEEENGNKLDFKDISSNNSL